MYAVSDRWDAAARTSGTIVSRAEVWRNGSPVLVPVDGQMATLTLNVTGGNVRVDDSSKVRRKLTLSCSDVELMPNDINDLLLPVDTDLKVFSGFGYTEGDTELVPVFTGRLSEPGRPGWLDDLKLTAVDYARPLDEARFPRPWNVSRSSGTRGFDLFRSIVKDVLPWVNIYNLTGRNPRVGAMSFDRSRTDALTSLAAFCGGEWWFTPDGDCVVAAPARSLSPDPVWYADAGTTTSVLTASGQSMNADGIYNAVTATYTPQGDGVPVSVTVYLTQGPLRYRDGFQRPRFYKTSLPMTKQDLTIAAMNLLRQSAQMGTRVSASCAPNPALEVGDVVQATLPDRSTPKRLLNGFTIPLTVGDIGSGMALDLVTPVELEEIGDVDA